MGENFLQEDIIRERVAAATISLRVGRWLAVPDQRPAGRRRGRRGRGDRAQPGARRAHRRARSATRWCRASARSRSRRCSAGCWRRRSATTCTTGWSTWRSTSSTAGCWPTRTRWPRCSASGRRGGRRRGSTTPSSRGCTASCSAGSIDIRDDPRHHARAGAGLDARPARPGPAPRPGHPGAHRAPQGPAARPPPGHRVERSRSGTRCAATLQASLVDPEGAVRLRLRRRGLAPSPTGCSSRRPLRARLDGIASDAAVFAVERYGAEVTTVITHTIERWDGQRGRPPDRAARRSRPAVHPDQRHHRRRPRRRAHPRLHDSG